MGSLNKVMLIGNLGKDPEIRHMDNGAVKASFPLATTEVYKSADGARQERTEWHNIVMWRGLANLAEKYLRKGKQVFIEGKLTSRSFEDQNGVKKYIHEVVAEHIVLMSTERREENREPNSGSGGGNLNEGGMGWSSGDDSGFDELT
jgi:single-strand DNA-binding protein